MFWNFITIPYEFTYHPVFTLVPLNSLHLKSKLLGSFAPTSQTKRTTVSLFQNVSNIVLTARKYPLL